MSDVATITLPESSDVAEWSPEEKALLAAAGLYVAGKRGEQGHWADRGTVAAFLQHCRRTGLDPIARQIYAIERAGKWGIQVSIDGMRVVAQRSREYRGQTPVQWTKDGVTWVDVWLLDEPPAAARVGVRRTGFEEPLFAVARWKSFAVYDAVWEDGPNGNRRKTNRQEPSAMWGRMPDHMLAKVTEALALRKAFPMDLSGLYIAEEMEAGQVEGDAPAEAPAVLRTAQRAPLPAAVTPEEGVSAGDGRTAPETGITCVVCGESTAEIDGTPCEECLADIEDAETAS